MANKMHPAMYLSKIFKSDTRNSSMNLTSESRSGLLCLTVSLAASKRLTRPDNTGSSMISSSSGSLMTYLQKRSASIKVLPFVLPAPPTLDSLRYAATYSGLIGHTCSFFLSSQENSANIVEALLFAVRHDLLPKTSLRVLSSSLPSHTMSLTVAPTKPA